TNARPGRRAGPHLGRGDPPGPGRGRDRRGLAERALAAREERHGPDLRPPDLSRPHAAGRRPRPAVPLHDRQTTPLNSHPSPPSPSPLSLQHALPLARTGALVADRARIWDEEIRPALAEAGIAVVSPSELSPRGKSDMDRIFARQIYPVLTPLAVGPGLPFPY